MIRSFLDPAQWGFRHILAALIVLSAINLFGPKGFVHLYYLKKESERVEEEKKQVSAAILELERDIHLFQSSKIVRSRAIRQHLGYVEENEISVELPLIKSRQEVSPRETRILR